MDVFDVLAVVGAVTGSASAAATVVSVVRDRPRIKVNFGYRESIGGFPEIWVTVLNHGRQPITIREAGFYGSELPIEIERPTTGEKFTGTAYYTFKVIDKAELLDPGRQCEGVARIPDSVENGYHVDYPLRAYVETARGNTIWGEAAPLVRMVIGDLDRPDFISPVLWEPTAAPLKPARVEPKWKLWARRELRSGDSGRPSAEDLEVLTGASR